MEPIVLFNIVLHPHTWPLVLGVPSFLIITALIGAVYELISNLNSGE
jgi:hypothetical protein